MTPQPQILLIDKPAGITSFGVLRKLRRILNVKKAGHAGTLDPMATGLLVVGINEGTKQLTNLVKLDKTYQATIRFGERYSTGDITGELLEAVPVEETLEEFSERLAEVVASFSGTHELPVSAFSAIKVAGKPLYKHAYKAIKKGVSLPEAPTRTMVVHTASIFGADVAQGTCVEVEIEFSVGSGTYIRSLAEELGRRLGYPATLAALRRTKVGEFDITDARTIESYIT
jgi:tRNA pseudouridine55 synthase